MMLDCYKRIWIQTKITLFLVLLILARLTETTKIDAAHLPTVYMPEKFDHIHLQGFSQAMILSQRGQRYSSNLDCTMTLTVRGPFGIQLAFEHIDLARDTYDADSPCEDYVQFYGGTAKETLLSGQHCGSGQPPDGLITNASSVTLRFRTNHYRERSGFRIKFDRIHVDLLSDCDERGVCSLTKGEDEEAQDDRGIRAKRGVREAAPNSGLQVGSRWSLESLMVISLSLWTSLLLIRVPFLYGPQNR